MKEKWRDFLWGTGFALFGAAILVFMPSLITGKYSTEAGPTIFPKLLATGIMIVGGCLSVGSLIGYLKARRGDTAPDTVPFTLKCLLLIKAEWKVAVFMVLALVYVLLYQQLGYFVTSFVISTLLLLLFNSRKKSQYIAVYATILVLYIGFRFGLSATLPLGSWFGL